MRTERIFLFGTHFFLRNGKGMFSTHMGIRQNALSRGISTLPLHHQKNNNGVPEANINPQGSGNKL